jgi:thiol-disulfide isomerase/thioredoxin
MSSFDSKASSRKFLVLLGAILALGAVAGLYVIFLRPVHALNNVPDTLAKLKVLHRPETAPAIAITDGAGNRHMLVSSRHGYVLVNLWASWCGPCVRELPALAKLKAAIAPARLTVLAVNVGRSNAAETAAFLKKHGASGLGVWLDSDVALMRAFDAYGLPTSVLIDPQGKVVARAVGAAKWDAPSALAYFRALPRPKPQPKPKKPAAATPKPAS